MRLRCSPLLPKRGSLFSTKCSHNWLPGSDVPLLRQRTGGSQSVVSGTLFLSDAFRLPGEVAKGYSPLC